MIFAPRSNNFYKAEIFPGLSDAYERDKKLIEDSFNEIKERDEWLEYPDKENIQGKCDIWPLYMFNVTSDSRVRDIDDLYSSISRIPDVKTCAFITLDGNSTIKKRRQWKYLNNTLRCMMIIKSPDYLEESCGIWVNGEIKKILTEEIMIFDATKEHSIYNRTSKPLHILAIDIERPKKTGKGSSDRPFTDEIYEFIQKLV